MLDKYNIQGSITSFSYVFPVFVSAVFAPITGNLCDSTGNFRSVWYIASIFLLIPFSFYLSGISLGSDILNSLVPLFFLGVFYGVANIIR